MPRFVLQNCVLARVRALYESMGALPVLGIVAGVVAMLLQHLTRLPGSYTWLDPLRLWKTALQQSGFPAAVVATYAVGALSRRTGRERFTSPDAASWRAQLLSGPDVLRAMLATLLLLAFDGLVLEARRTLLDLAALVLIAVVVSRYRMTRAEFWRHLGLSTVALCVFLVICYFYSVSKALTFVSGRSYDAGVIALETVLFGAPLHRAVAAFMSQHAAAVDWCDWVYFRFLQHMGLTAVLLAALRRTQERTEYLGALAFCYLFGGVLYHVFPTAGPAFFEPQYFAFLRNAPLVTTDVNTWLAANTSDVLSGKATEVRTFGYVACMPSLHVAQELVMLYYSRHARVALVLCSLFVVATLFAVVALGWHYPLDALAGGCLAFGAIRLARRLGPTLMPSGLQAHRVAPGKHELSA